jgi:hypothetical protein
MFDKIIKKWWFYLLLMLLTFIIPSITEKSFSSRDTPLLIQDVLINPIIYKIPVFFPIAKIILLFLFICPVILKNKIKRIFPLIVFLLMLIILFLQNISLETRYGYAVISGNILIQLFVVFSWIYELKVQRNNFSNINFYWWKIIYIILAFMAFWMPAKDGYMHFSVIDIFLNEAGLTYCMITPVIITSMIMFYPNVNKVTLRVTSFVGLYFGIMNLLTFFILNPEYRWMGVLHIPLFIISLTGLILSKKFKNAV